MKTKLFLFMMIALSSMALLSCSDDENETPSGKVVQKWAGEEDHSTHNPALEIKEYWELQLFSNNKFTLTRKRVTPSKPSDKDPFYNLTKTFKGTYAGKLEKENDEIHLTYEGYTPIEGLDPVKGRRQTHYDGSIELILSTPRRTVVEKDGTIITHVTDQLFLKLVK